MIDFRVVNVPGMRSVSVKSYDANMIEIPDDGAWHLHALAAQYVLAEFLVGHGLVNGLSSIARRSDLIIMWSELSPVGQAFVKAAVDKWHRSIDRVDTSEEVMVNKLERRWRSFTPPN